ncbi:MAG TPA: carboxypeptidase-like regulatory domain-containing protein [Chitinophagaceae bacterium]|nr:carboxypeptidase-like regulatory domain-containing protein [Chitinophagaceae bacterium]
MSKLVLPVLILAFAGCSKGGDDDGGGSKPGIITGIVKDEKGNPLRNAHIIIDNSITSGNNVDTYTGSDGKYTMSIPVGSFIAYGQYDAPFHGNTYEYELVSDNNDPFNREEAVVRNFTWKTKGRKDPPLTPGYHGGSVHVDKGLNSTVLDRENIVFTLKPVETIDGSNANITARLIEDTYRLLDIPVGRYRISARHTDGTVIKLRIKNTGSFVNELETELVPQIEGVGGVWCWNCVSIEYE